MKSYTECNKTYFIILFKLSGIIYIYFSIFILQIVNLNDKINFQMFYINYILK